MASSQTNHLGLNRFGPSGAIADDGYKFALKDRELIDALLWSLLQHDHRQVYSAALEGPAANTPPPLTSASTGGTFPAGRTLFYKVAYLDADGNETHASTAGSITTTPAISAPLGQNLTTATTGGTITDGTYRYAMSFYQTGVGDTTAPNISTQVITSGTDTNTITIPLQTLPDGANGWKIYRKSPGELEFYLLATVSSGTSYTDDGSVSPDCTKKRPTTNTTNSTNKITVSIPTSEIPLDPRVTAWRIYRTSNAGAYPYNSLVATVVETTTEGGSDLITSFDDLGGALLAGIPLNQSATPPPVPQLDAGDIWAASSARLPSHLSPLGVQSMTFLCLDTLAAQDYHQFSPPHDIKVERIDLYYQGANPTGLDTTTNYLTLRISDDSDVDEVQSIHNDAITQNEFQRISNDASSGTFTLSFDGQGPTGNIDFDDTAATIKTELELLSNITEVFVTGSGTAANPWVVEFVDPGAENVAQITATDTNLVGGSTTITTSIIGSDGGTFTLSDGTDTTSAIDFDASAGTIETRLETDITSITAVTVTGSGTATSPWLVTFENPGGQQVDLLVASDTSLNGTTTITEVTRGRGPTQVDLLIQANQAYHFFQTPTDDYGEQEAELSPATGGVTVSDTLATNDAAKELDTQNETNEWNIGTGPGAGTYTFRFWVATPGTAEATLRVLDDTTTLDSLVVAASRSTYNDPYYEIEVDIDGTEDLNVEVEKTDAGGDVVRVDKYEYELNLPTLYAGQTVTAEILVTGSPTTNGDDAQVTMWY